MLVVVEDWNRHRLAKRLLDVETLRSLDVLEVDATHRGLEKLAELDDVFWILGADFQIENVNVSEALEEHCLAFHDGLSCQGSDVAQPEHRSAIRDDSDKVSLCRVLERQLGLLLDLQAGLSDARRVGQAQVPLGAARL